MLLPNLKDLITERDGQSHDIARWSWLVAIITTIGGAIWNAFHTGTLDLMQFAQAIGIISGACGAAVMMKVNTEQPFVKPQDPPDDDSQAPPKKVS